MVPVYETTGITITDPHGSQFVNVDQQPRAVDQGVADVPVTFINGATGQVVFSSTNGYVSTHHQQVENIIGA